MWKCHKCGKPVYFAERKQSLGYDWHPECLRCEECGKRLNPGQHAEHKGVPYCHVPCYGALFGPQLFGHGTRVESHKSYGVKSADRLVGTNGSTLSRNHLESKLKVYNQFYDNKSMEIRSREVNNRLILEGALRVYWGVQAVIHLKEDDDQRTFVVRKRNSCRMSKATDDSTSDRENDCSESFIPTATTTDLEGLSTDISLSESITFDSCSLNECPITELPTTPENTSINISDSTGLTNGDNSTSSVMFSAENAVNTSTTNCSVSSSLPSKLEAIEKSNWDEIDDLLQVERRFNKGDNIYETMPVKLPSSTQSSASNSPSKSSVRDSSSSTTVTTDNSVNICTTNSSLTHSYFTITSDNFVTANSPFISDKENTHTSITTTTSLNENQSSDDITLKPIDFDDFKRSVHEEYMKGTNSFQEHSSNTLKNNQPIDPSRINDSLKFYGDYAMSKSFNCEHALRSIDGINTSDSTYLKNNCNDIYFVKRNELKKSGSVSTSDSDSVHECERLLIRKGLNRSKSGPSCFNFSDSDDDDSTLKPHNSTTTREKKIKLCSVKSHYYVKHKSDKSGSESEVSYLSGLSITNSGAAGGDELTHTGEVVMDSNKYEAKRREPPLLHHITEDGVILRRPPRTGATAIKRRSGNRRSRTKLKRRCSINGHFYNRETSFFTPPYGSQMSVWVTSLVTTQEVINLVLEKYKVDSPADNFTLFIIRDNGEQKRIKDNDYPLITRVMLGPHEDVARLFLVDARKTDEISNEVAQFLNLSLPECQAIIQRYDQEMNREIAKVKDRYAELQRRIMNRMDSLKVHL